MEMDDQYEARKGRNMSRPNLDVFLTSIINDKNTFIVSFG